MFNENMRILRRARGLTQPDIAEKLNYKSFTTIQKWEDGTAVPPYKVLVKLAEILDTSIDALMSNETIRLDSSIPVLGIVRGGQPIFASQNIMDYEKLNVSNPEEYFCLDVVGDSMKNARILPGDRLFVHKQDTVENKEIGVVLIGDEATVKRIIFDKGNLILQPENDDYQPIVLTEKDQEEKGVKILGKVVYNKINY